MEHDFSVCSTGKFPEKVELLEEVVYHLHGETGWSMVCANGKQNSHVGNFRLGWRVPFEQQTQLTERA